MTGLAHQARVMDPLNRLQLTPTARVAAAGSVNTGGLKSGKQQEVPGVGWGGETGHFMFPDPGETYREGVWSSKL